MLRPHVRAVLRPRVLVALAATVLVVLGVDAGARWWLQARFTDRAAAALEQHGLKQVRVSVGGWPVLAGVVTGRLARVDVAAELPFAVLDERLAAGHVAGGVGAVQWSGESGMLVGRAQLDRNGTTVPVAVAFSVSADGGDLVVQPQTVSLAGIQLPAPRVAGLLPAAASFLATRRLALGDLGDLAGRADGGSTGLAQVLADASVVSVRVETDGIALVVRADDVGRDVIGPTSPGPTPDSSPPGTARAGAPSGTARATAPSGTAPAGTPSG